MVESSGAVQGFEHEFLERLRGDLVRALPEGTADFYVGHPASHPNSLPYFRITPTNPRAAKIQGFVCEGQGIDFTIGEATGGEVFVSRKRNAEDRIGVEKFFQICRAVFTSHFSETIVLNPRGRRLWSKIVLTVDGRKVRLQGGSIFWFLFPRRAKRVICYEPYYGEEHK